MTKILLHPTAFRTHTDTELVALVRAGNDPAFDVIVARHEPALIAYARQLLGGAHHDAEDWVQDALIMALRSLRGADRPMALERWLYAITRNRCFDQLRKPGRDVDLALLEPVLSDAGGDPHAAAVLSEELGAMLADLDRLPARQRVALVMHELEDCSHAEIATALNVSVGATKALVCRARATLGAMREAA